MKRLVILPVLIAMSSVFFFSCDLLSGPISAEKRVELFEADVVAGNYGSLVNHLSDSDTETDIAIYNSTYWSNTAFKAENNPSAIIQNSASTSGNDVIISATLVTIFGDFEYTFTLSPDASGDYYIHKIIDGSGSEVVKKM